MTGPVPTPASVPPVSRAPSGFDDWAGLHALLVTCFAYMEGRIDPPSSLAGTSPADLAARARDEILLLARASGRPVACGFLAPRPPVLYLGKLAVDPAWRGRGLLRRMVALAEEEARARGLAWLELGTRVELAETHAAFAALGFGVVGESRHPGFSRTTSLTMRRALA